MSDVAGAFKVLIEAQPDQAVDAFQKILDAANKSKDGVTGWSDVVTGLNQGWELASKVVGGAADAIVTIGEKAFEAAKSVGEFIAAGGEYSEQKTQLDNLAASYGQSGDQIVRMIQKISDNTLSMGDTMRVASKTLASGMSGPEMETALTYAKKWSESTGQEFDSVAESITNAMAKGKFAALKEMGIIVNKGDEVSSIVEKMREGLSRFGDSGQNINDSFESLKNTWDEFLLKIGKALNDIPALGQLFGELADGALKFVQEFDPSAITEWGEVAVQTVEAFAKAFVGTMPDVGKTIADMFSGSHTTAKEFFTSVTDMLFDVYKSFAETWNKIIETFQGLNFGNWATTLFSDVTTLFGQIAEATAQLVGMLVKQVTDGVSSALGVIEALAINNPNLAEFIGIDTTQIEAARKNLEEFANAAESAGNNAADFFKGTQEAVAGMFDNANQKADGWKINLSDIDKMHGQINESISNITYDPVVKKAADAMPEIKRQMEAAMKVLTTDISVDFDLSKLDFSKLQSAVTSGGFSSALKELQRDYKDLGTAAEDSFKAQQQALLKAFEEATSNEKNQKQLVEQFKAGQKEELEEFKKKQQGFSDAFKERIDKEKAGFKEREEAAAKAYKREQEDAKAAFEAAADMKKTDLKRQLEDEGDAFKRRQEWDLAAFKEATKNAANKEQLLKNFEMQQEEAAKRYKRQEEDRLRDYEAGIKQQTVAFNRQQEDAKDALDRTGSAAGTVGEKLANAAAAFKDKLSDLPATLQDSFKAVESLGKEYLDALKEDPYTSASSRAMETKKLLDQQVEAQERLVKAMEKLADPANLKKEIKVNITVDGKDDAVGALAKEVLNRAMTDAEVEDTIVAGV